MNLDEAIAASLATLRARAGALAPKIAVLLGSGWGPVADLVQDAVDRCSNRCSDLSEDVDAFMAMADSRGPERIRRAGGLLHRVHEGAKRFLFARPQKYIFNIDVADRRCEERPLLVFDRGPAA